MKRRLAFSLSTIYLLTFLAVVVAGPTLPDLEVQYDRENDLLSVRARQIPLGTLLQEIAQKAALSVETRKDEFLREPVSLELKGLPLEEALTRLLREFNSAFLYSTGTTTPRLVKIVLISKKSSMPFEAQAPKDEQAALEASAAKEPAGAVASSATDTSDLVRRVLEFQRDGEQTKLMDLLLDKVKHRDPEIQRLAVSFLIRSPDPLASQILADVLRDARDLHSRKLAAYGLIQRDDVAEGMAALTHALKDPDPEVRYVSLLALSTLGARVQPAITQAVNDPDPKVSQTARIVLRDIAGRQ